MLTCKSSGRKLFKRNFYHGIFFNYLYQFTVNQTLEVKNLVRYISILSNITLHGFFSIELEHDQMTSDFHFYY